jgi:transcriptional regulator with XRE-family HTH domain
MSYLNKTILVTNIEALRKEQGLSQAEFAAKIDMSQPNYSRAISENNSQCFTTEQLYNIATEFNVSIDSLMGLKQNHTDREICSLFTSLLEQRKLVKVDYTREEWVYTPFTNDGFPDCHQEKEKINYPAFIFPNYYDRGPREAFTEEQIENLEYDALYFGNEDKSNQQINAYFDKFLSLYEIHLVKKIPDDAYQKVVEEFLNNLK